MIQVAANFKELLKREDLFDKATTVQENELRNLLKDGANNVVEFFINYQPYNIPMLDSYVKLIGIDNIIIENTKSEPGKYLAQFGVFVIAVTVGGNVICIDTNDAKDGDPSVLIADANFCSYNQFWDCIEIGIVPDDVTEQLQENELLCLNYDNIKKCLNKIEDSFIEFMLKLSKNQYDDIEKYL